MALDHRDAPGNAPPPDVGRLVGGRYRLQSVLGRGGMGVVWAAQDELLERAVALKQVLVPREVDPQERASVRARTLREARTAARVTSDAVVRLLDVVEDPDGVPWVVMERLPARTLADELDRRGALPPHEVARIGLDLLAGLEAAHAAGVLHRDVKPGNVLFREHAGERRAVLGDFGIAHVDGDPSLTSTSMLMGSPRYVAPERARGGPATPASDLWSLGVTLWGAVEGRPPFDREGPLATLTAVLTEEVPPARHAGPLHPVLEGLLRKDPAERIDAARARALLASAVAAPAAPPRRPSTSGSGPRLAPFSGGRPTTSYPPVVRPAAAGAGTGPHDPAPAADVVPGSSTTPALSNAPGSVPATGGAADAAWWEPAAGEPVPEQAPSRSPRRARPAPRRGLLIGAAAAAAVALGAAVVPWDDVLGADPTAAQAPQDDATGAGPADGAEDPQPGPEAQGSPDGAADAADDAAAGDPDVADPAEGEVAPEAPAPPAGDSEVPDPAQEPATGTAETQAAVVPEGFQLHQDPTGFSVAVPAGWTAEREGPRVYLRDPGSRAYLLVDQTSTPAPDPVADWQQQEPAVAGRLEHYERLGAIEPVDFRGWQAADWEFVFGETQGTHVLNRNVVTAPDQAYALYWSVPSSQWEQMLPVHEQVVASFVPAG